MEQFEPARGASSAGSAAWRVAGLFAIWLLAASAAYAQTYPPGTYPPGGGYPPGSYPPGTYPNGTPGNYPGSGPGIPIGRGKSKADTSTKGQPMPNFRGKLQSMDGKTISIALDDDRQVDFKRNDKTKFFKNGEEVKTPKFAIGDQLSVEGPEDEKGYFIAVNVYWEKAAGAETAAANDRDKQGGAVDTWKDSPKQAAAANAPAVEPVTHVEQPSKPDSDDPGPPVLHRGQPADVAREHAPEPPAEAPAPTGSAAPQTAASLTPPVADYKEANDEPTPELRPQQGDDLIRRAAGAAFDFTEGLPNYVCQEQIARYASQTRPADWRAIDIVSAAVVYENGKEDYRDIKVNGKPRPSSRKPTALGPPANSAPSWSNCSHRPPAPNSTTAGPIASPASTPASTITTWTMPTRAGTSPWRRNTTCRRIEARYGSIPRPRACCASRKGRMAFPPPFPPTRWNRLPTTSMCKWAMPESTCCPCIRRT